MAEKLNVYFDPASPAAYGGLLPLAKTTKLKTKDVGQWLSEQDAYTLHKPIRRKFPRRRVIVGGIDHQWQADLVDVSKLAKQNKGTKFLLTCIDVFSKYAWVVPLTDKTGESLIRAFAGILKQGRKPLCLQTDKGGEFINRKFQTFLKKHNIRFFTTHNEETKASIAERFNRTLKTKMWRYFTKHNTNAYLPVLTSLVKGYNRSYHRSIKRTPASVSLKNQEDTWMTLYGQGSDGIKRPKYKVGDRVRITNVRGKFKKGYTTNWSEELFRVARVHWGLPNVYAIKDDGDEVLEGTFYEEELQRVNDKDWYRIEKIIKERKRKGRKEYFVKWFGYPSSFNSWVGDVDLYKN